MTFDEIASILGPRPPLQRGVWSRAHHEWQRKQIELEGGFYVAPSTIPTSSKGKR